MTKHMLIDASHPEETRVVVVDGKRVEEFDFESAARKPLKGNIYLARVTRVEPSLQAAFVEYGGNRHGFLAFGEIHPDYYRIPVADREALERALAQPDDTDEMSPHPSNRRRPWVAPEMRAPATVEEEIQPQMEGSVQDQPDLPVWPGDDQAQPDVASGDEILIAADIPGDQTSALRQPIWQRHDDDVPVGTDLDIEGQNDHLSGALGDDPAMSTDPELFQADAPDAPGMEPEAVETDTTVEVIGGGATDIDEAADSEDDAEERAQAAQEARRARFLRKYKIQEVIKRRQIMLIQVTKEERGNKGAALTTYLSLAGRYCVLMPNTPRGGGVSRKITNQSDRKRLKSIVGELELPEGMAVIVRTAGSERSKAEIRRDYDYLLRLWTEIRDLTLRSTAPSLIYEEGSLIKRSIRDLYSRDVDGVIAEGEEGYKAAKAFMRTLMPSHAKRVQLYRDPSISLFQKYQVESQLDAIHNPVIQLRSGGYIVINSTEALVAIDVNSGRSTRERHIEETAVKTNLEAAEEVARQLRLRDLAGLVVIDFIDMEDARHNAAVERKLKEAMRHDRARIQMGRISPFGLLELSRQRLRPSLVESSTEICRHCHGTGHVRSTESTALHILRSLESEALRQRSVGFAVSVPTSVALYMLNHKRRSLADIESRTGIRIYLNGDDALIPPEFRLERLSALAAGDDMPVPVINAPVSNLPVDDDIDIEDDASDDGALDQMDEDIAPRSTESDRTTDATRSSREGNRNRRRRKPAKDRAPRIAQEAAQPPMDEADSETIDDGGDLTPDHPMGSNGAGDETPRRRRRGRRGGRRRRRTSDDAGSTQNETADVKPEPSTAFNDASTFDAGERNLPPAPTPVTAESPAPVMEYRNQDDGNDQQKRKGWWSRFVS